MASLKLKSLSELQSGKKRSLKKHRWYGYTFSREEDILHYEAVKFVKTNYPETVIQSNHLAGKSLKKTGQKFNPILKNIAALNGTKGMPDIILFHAISGYAGLAIELKKPKGTLSPEEAKVMHKLYEQNFFVQVVGKDADTIEEAVLHVQSLILDYMNGKL